ncbi:ABC transporter substrate-binding protein [Propioniciclava coleopterorum]|uniref:ABC transporter substrate-binding protein n=1 Tax=Propioniciclava coleopterorum TaxID=2714937 RepID=UPI001FEC1842|nr:ABC transporter substrate-binding protein [Propioniciclava coleopterorum]
MRLQHRPHPAPTAGGDTSKPTISSWYHQYGEDGVESALRTWAGEYPSAKVDVNWVMSDYEKALSAALLTPTAPDVFENANGPTLDMIKSGQVTDLTDVVGSARAQFTPPVLARMTYQDKIWAVPQTVDMQLLYYRKSALAAKGLQPPPRSRSSPTSPTASRPPRWAASSPARTAASACWGCS